MDTKQPTNPLHNSEDINSTQIAKDTNTVSPKKSKKLLVVLAIITLTGGAVAGGLLLFKDKESTTVSEVSPQNTETVQALSNEQIFDEMLKLNYQTTSYKVSMTHEQVQKTQTQNYEPLKYNYNAIVDSSNHLNLKIDADFKFEGTASGSFTSFEGNTIFDGPYIYTKASSITGKLGAYYYGDFGCAGCAKVPDSPTKEQFLADYAQTNRGDLVQNGSNADYTHYIDSIFSTNAPLGAFPIINLTESDQKTVAQLTGKHNGGLYTLYDGKTEIDQTGKELVYFTVLAENYKIEELNDFLEELMQTPGNDTDAELRKYAMENTIPGERSPGHYYKIWIDKQSYRLKKVQSIVDTADVPVTYTTTLEYSDYNTPVSIQAPESFVSVKQ